MKGKRRVFAAATCLVLLLVMFSSAAYIILEAHHDCAGENCPICHEIQICRQVLNTLGTASAGRPALAFFILFAFLLTCAPVRAATAVTLISLKVKLSD